MATPVDKGADLTVDGMPQRRRIQVDHYDYNVGIDEEEDFASALKLSATERQNHLLQDQVEDIESRLFDLQESAVLLKRKIALVDAEAKDYQDLLKQRDESGKKCVAELESVHKSLEKVLSKRAEIEAERRKYEQRIALLETELENNQRAEHKLEKTLLEIETLKKQARQLVVHNGDLQQLSDRQLGKMAELQKNVKDNQLESRLQHNKTVDSIEKEIVAQRQRGQQLIDENRKQLKAKITVLEAALKDYEKTGLDSNKEMRKLERNLKAAIRTKEDQDTQLSREARRIESLERQLQRYQEQTEKLQYETTELETVTYGKKREVDTLSAQYQAALWVNKKLNEEIPEADRIFVWDPSSGAPPSAPVSGQPSGKPAPQSDQPKTVPQVDQRTTAPKVDPPKTAASEQPKVATKPDQPKPVPQADQPKAASKPAPQPDQQKTGAKFSTDVDLSDVDVKLKVNVEPVTAK
jgi:chromosome segregation ATPase